MNNYKFKTDKILDLNFNDGWRVDRWLLATLCIILSFSSIVVFSASNENVELMKSHVIHCLLAVVTFILSSRLNVVYVKQVATKVFVVTIALLVAVEFFGDLRMGARRWLDLGFINFQPSELAKLSVPMMCALIVANTGLATKFKHILMSVCVIAIPAFLVLQQPDLGTAIMIAFSGFSVMFFSGLPMGLIAGGVIIGVASSPVVWYHILRPYQRERIMTIFDPEADLLGAGYHVSQAKSAIGAGGVDGAGVVGGYTNSFRIHP